MNRNLKIAAIIIGVLILIVIAIPFFIDANAFRPKLESELSDALGRPVKVGTLSLSLFSGAVKADDIPSRMIPLSARPRSCKQSL